MLPHQLGITAIDRRCRQRRQRPILRPAAAGSGRPAAPGRRGHVQSLTPAAVAVATLRRAAGQCAWPAAPARHYRRAIAGAGSAGSGQSCALQLQVPAGLQHQVDVATCNL